MSDFVPRLEKPEAGNKYYNTKTNGGYSTAIVGKPTDPGCNVLANCFAGETLIITEFGLARLDKLSGKAVRVLTRDGEYREANGVAFGSQESYRIIFEDDSSVVASFNHRWLVNAKTNPVKREETKTTDERPRFRYGEIEKVEEETSERYSGDIYKTTEELEIGDVLPKINDGSIKVKSVKSIGIVPVYCVQEPETKTMVLGNGVITGNCVGYAFGRFNEIAGDEKMSLLLPVNAERFYSVAQSQGLEVGQMPRVGAIMCWQKGETLDGSDGAGHVAVVENVISDTMVQTSESGYNNSKAFWTQIRSKGAGNWAQSAGYKFLGFIYNPAVKKDPDPYQIPTRVLSKGSSGSDVMWLQWKLKNLKYLNDEIDGHFGVYTLGALLAFQLEHDLDVDGYCGPATRTALQKL